MHGQLANSALRLALWNHCMRQLQAMGMPPRLVGASLRGQQINSRSLMCGQLANFALRPVLRNHCMRQLQAMGTPPRLKEGAARAPRSAESSWKKEEGAGSHL